MSAVDLAKAIKETKKKLQQIEDVVEKTGKTLNNKERVKVTLTSTLINQMAKFEACAAAEHKNHEYYAPLPLSVFCLS